MTSDSLSSTGDDATPAGPSQPGPFQGLSPYAEDDAPFFFGRGELRRMIIDNLHAYRLTVV